MTPDTVKVTITVLYSLELASMLLASGLGLLIWRKVRASNKPFFFWLSVSMGFFALSQLGLFIHTDNPLANINIFSAYFRTIVNYLSFGAIIYAYLKVLDICQLITWKMSRVFITVVPLVLMILLIAVSFSAMYPWSRSSTIIGLMGFISSMEQLLLISVLLLSFCMLKIGKLYYIYISALFAMSADMIDMPVRWYNGMTHEIFYRAFLVSCMVLYLVGLWLIYRKAKFFNLRRHFVKFNSFQAQMVLFGFTMTELSLILFIIIEMCLPSLPFFTSYDSFTLMPSLLIIFATLSMVFCSTLAKVINRSFLGINKLIHIIGAKDLTEPLTARQASPIEEFNQIESVLLKGREALVRNIESERMFSNLATYFAHDIRSPLVTLEMLISDLPKVDADTKTIINNSVYRIESICNNFLRSYKRYIYRELDSKSEVIVDKDAEPVATLLESIYLEKVRQYQDRKIQFQLQIEPGCYADFAEFVSFDFERMISNLINNSVEAMEQVEGPSLEVTLKRNKDGKLSLSIKDNGKGISPEALEKVKKAGVTLGKQGGTGLGLTYTLQRLAEWGWQYQLNSEVGKFTEIVIGIPLAKSPNWFTNQLSLIEGSSVAIIDDDPEILNQWQATLSTFNLQVQLYASPTEVPSDSRYEHLVVDYEFYHEKQNGLDWIISNDLCRVATLSTSLWRNKKIINHAVEHQVRLLPKQLIDHVKINLLPNEADYLLVDDEAIIRRLWSMHFEKQGLRLITFESAHELLSVASHYKQAKVYIDVNLGDGDGIELASQLHQLGYQDLYLATGMQAAEIKDCPKFIKAVCDKDPRKLC